MLEQKPSHRSVLAMSRRVRRAVVGALAYLAFVTFGILLIVDGDWVPGSLILGAGIVGWAVVLPLLGHLSRQESAPSPPAG